VSYTGHGGFTVQFEADPTVRVPDVVLNCVAFIGEATHADSENVTGDLHATGFFVCVPFSIPSLAHKRWAFFVTAGHVAKDLSEREIYFLVNKRGGGVTGMEVLSNNWMTHPTDRTADVAAIPVALNKEADIRCIATADFVRPFDFTKDNVGVGDEVFITGLFTAAPGQSRNLPIVRHGNLAMLPTEQIQTELGFADVHLIEARSIGGLSGSPVFVRSAEYLGEGRDSTRGIKLLGLMHGHWDINPSEMNRAQFAHDSKRGVNLGIGIVVPATKILETINKPAAVEFRTEMEKQIERKNMPRMDSARPKSKSDDPAITREDFEAALKKASRKIEPTASDKTD
jgi:hypothetical protein